jgi:hypothetical protein
LTIDSLDCILKASRVLRYSFRHILRISPHSLRQGQWLDTCLVADDAAGEG